MSKHSEKALRKRLRNLKVAHKALNDQIDEEQNALSDSKNIKYLKSERLKVKDEIVSLELELKKFTELNWSDEAPSFSSDNVTDITNMGEDTDCSDESKKAPPQVHVMGAMG